MFKKKVSWLLAMIIIFTMLPAFAADKEVSASPSNWSVYVNGELTALKGYNIGGTNYYKLRDIAMAVSGTAKQFDVNWKAETNEIFMTSALPYTVAGGELSDKADFQERKAYPTKSPIYLDNKLVNYNSYYINGNNYFRLREILKSFDIGLSWKNEDKSVNINTSLSYVEENESTKDEDLASKIVVVRKLDEYRNTVSESLGFLISEDGKVATSFLAIRGAEAVTVSYPGKAEKDIEGIVAWDKEKNIAVIKTDLETNSPVVIKDGDVSAQDKIIAYTNTGKAAVVPIEGKVIDKIASTRTKGSYDFMLSLKLDENSVGTPVADASGRVVGIAYSGIYQGSQQMLMIPISEIYGLNLNANVKTVAELRKELYILAGNASDTMLSDMLDNVVNPMRFDEDILNVKNKVELFGVRANIADEKKHELFIQVYVAENEGNGFFFREYALTENGAARITEYLEKMMGVIETYFPEYQISGQIACGMVTVLEEDEEGNPIKYGFHLNEEDEGSVVDFGYGSEYNGWKFRIE